MKINIFTFGIGRVIASGYAMKHCIPFLKTERLKPMIWIKSNGIQMYRVTHINFESVR